MRNNETRAKILMVLNANGGRMTTEEILDHKLLQSENLNNRSLGINLGFLRREKLVRKYKDKTWASIHLDKAEEPSRAAQSQVEMYFVLNPTAKTLALDVGGIRLPVKVET